MTTAVPILLMQGVRVAFVRNVVLDIERFEVPAVPNPLRLIMGPNGAAKTTFVNAVTAYAPVVHGGRIFVHTSETHELTGLAPHAVVRRGVARTFQSPPIFPSLTIRQSMLLSWLGTCKMSWYHRVPLWIASVTKSPLVDRLIDELCLTEFADTVIGQLPLHLVRRAELARCLVTQPRLLFLDEPTAGADTAERDLIGRLLVSELPRVVRELHSVGLYAHSQLTVCIVTHDLNFARGLRDSNLGLQPFVHVLNQGRLIASAALDDVMGDPLIQKMYLGGG